MTTDPSPATATGPDDAPPPAFPAPDRWILPLLERLEARFGLVAPALLAALLAEALSVLVAASFYDEHAGRFLGLSANPFARGEVNIPFPEHRMRILGPTIAWALGLRGRAGLLVPIAANVPILILFYAAVRRRAGHRLALAFVVLAATTHVTMSSRTMLGYHDSLVFLFITLAMLSRSTAACALAYVLALFGDPRAALTVPMIVLWHVIERPAPRPIAAAAGRGAVLVAATGLFLVAASALSVAFGYAEGSSDRYKFHLVGGFLSEIKPGYLQLSMFMAFKAAWALPVLLVWCWARWKPLAALVAAGNLVAIVGVSLLVQDVSRGLTFCFPAMLLGVLALNRSAPGAALNTVRQSG